MNATYPHDGIKHMNGGSDKVDSRLRAINNNYGHQIKAEIIRFSAIGYTF